MADLAYKFTGVNTAQLANEVRLLRQTRMNLHAVVPQEFKEPARYDFRESGTDGMWVRHQAGQVALDLGLPGANNADHLITRIPEACHCPP